MRFRNTAWALALLLPLVASAESSVWRMITEQGTVYLAGSIHVLRAADYPLPPEFDQAYADAQVLVLELDPAAAPQDDARRLVLSQGVYANGETIKDHLSPSVYARLVDYCARRKVPFASVERFRPWLLVMTLTMAQMQSGGFEPEAGIDMHLARRAARDGKPIHALETLEEQIGAIAAFDEDGDPLVANFLDEAETLPRVMDEIIRAWRAGEASRLEELAVREMRDKHPRLHEALLAARNRRWLQAIEQWAATDKRVLVVVGSAHLVGEEGLITLLRQRGHRIEKLRSAAAVP